MLFAETIPQTSVPCWRKETTQQLLERISYERSHIESLLLFAPDGKILAAAAKPAVSDQRLQIIAQEVWRTSQHTCLEQGMCDLKFFALQCRLGQIAATTLESGQTLAIVGRHHVRLGVLLYEVDGIAAELSKLLW